MCRTRLALVTIVAIAAVATGCKHTLRHPVTRKQDARPVSTVAPLAPAEPSAASHAPQLEEVEDRRGPFAIAGQTFTVVLHHERLPGNTGPDSQTLASLEILDGTGVVHYREAFSPSVEGGAFSEVCSADVALLEGSNGRGLLLDVGCVPSAPLSGGPWRVFGVRGGKLVPFGKPLVAEGEMAGFVPGAINRIGNLTQILPDTINIRLWTGYFFVSVPIRVDWLQGTLTLAQHCFHQTGHGFAEGGCEMPVQAELGSRDQELTFVRLFRESDESSGTPAHVVIKRDSKLAILAARVFVSMEAGPEVTGLAAGDDLWVKVRIDGTDGWIHTAEDLNAIGLFASG